DAEASAHPQRLADVLAAPGALERGGVRCGEGVGVVDRGGAQLHGSLASGARRYSGLRSAAGVAVAASAIRASSVGAAISSTLAAPTKSASRLAPGPTAVKA